MNKIKFVLFTASIFLAIAFTFSCSSGDGGGSEGNGSLSSDAKISSSRGSGSSKNKSSSSSVQSNSGSEQSYNYCIIAGNTCLTGPFTASTCTGQLSNNCPNGSSSSMKGSSSSVVVSSSSVQSSSSKGSSSSGDFSSSSSVNGQGVPFNENSQVYREDGIPYKGNGVIKIYVWNDDENEYKIIDNISAGSVTDGIVNFKLPTTISDGYLKPWIDEDEQKYCTNYPKDIKAFRGRFVLTNSNGDIITELVIGIDQNRDKSDYEYQGIEYMYFSKAGKINCNFRYEIDCAVGEGGEGSVYSKEECDSGIIHSTNIDAKLGWNKVYYRGNKSTNNILTEEVRWVLVNMK